MRILSSTLACALTIEFVCSAAGASGVHYSPRAAVPQDAVRSQARDPRDVQRGRLAASCASSGHGSYAFDSHTEFMTNFTATEIFGEADVAAGTSSGSFVGFGNVVCDEYAAIVGGISNVVDSGGHNTAASSFIGAGQDNASSGAASFIGSGSDNTSSNFGAVIGGGAYNTVSGEGSFIGAGGVTQDQYPDNTISGNDSFIGAGDRNTVGALEAFVGSGDSNTIAAGASYASILGGNHNSISGEYASVIGGYGNLANGAYAIVAGGNGDTAAGTLTFAAGYHADAAHGGSFVWSDYTSGSSTLKDTANNQFVVRASGGTYVYSNETMTTGVKLAAGSGTWASVSDRNAKTDLAPLDDASVLAKVDALPIGTWRYKSERGVRHAGPMAQDFYTAFGIGEDDRHITSIDEDGVALAAIKALDAKLVEKDVRVQAKLARKDEQVEALRADVRRLDATVALLARALRRQR